MNGAGKVLRRFGIAALVIAQLAAAGFVMPVTAGAFAAKAITRNMENLDRGVVAMMTENGVYITWRRLGTEPADTEFEVYRNKTKITSGAITNYIDAEGTINDFYTIVCNGTMSKSVPVLDHNYIEIPMAEAPDYEGDYIMSRNGITFGYYAPGDGTYGDLDGDGEYEIIILWNPSDAKDAASGGRTGKAYIDAYKLDGTFMWRIDMGWNIRAGAHDTQLCVADFDNDGCAELMVRTSDGTIDGVGNIIGDEAQAGAYEDSWAAKNGGKALQAPLYVTAFDGKTGAALDTKDYYPKNEPGSMAVTLSFGDDFGNRSERYNATIAWVNGKTPSAVFGRGYYFGKNGRQRQGACSYSMNSKRELVLDWVFDTEPGAEGYVSGNEIYVGQGNHQLEAADVDGDGKDEITTGALWYDDDGTVLWSSQTEHGDAVHVGDFDPRNEGLEILTAKEDYTDSAPHFSYDCPTLAGMDIKNAAGADLALGRLKWGIHLQDAKTGKYLQTWNGTKDTGRGVIANIGYRDSYYVMWGAGGTEYHDMDGNLIDKMSLSMNGRIYWTGDLQDELQDHKGAGREISIQKWNRDKEKSEAIFVPEGSHSVNSTKGNTCGQGDMIGDWREEFVSYVISGENSVDENITITGSFDKEIPVTVTKTKYFYNLRIYTTDYPTEYNFYTLAHDDVYRNSSGAYNNCYNQPPHISWYMNDCIEGSPYTTQPDCNIKLVPNDYTAKVFSAASLPNGGSGREWDKSTLPGASAQAADKEFSDCTEHWAKEYIQTLANAGIVDGVTDDIFNPDGTVTKGEFLKLIVASLKLSIGAKTEGENWAMPYYAAALKSGILAPELNLKAAQLGDTISRQEMASLIYSAAEYKKMKINENTGISFSDDSLISPPFYPYVYGAAGLGIIDGYEDGSFGPTRTATRAESCKIIVQLSY